MYEQGRLQSTILCRFNETDTCIVSAVHTTIEDTENCRKWEEGKKC